MHPATVFIIIAAIIGSLIGGCSLGYQARKIDQATEDTAARAAAWCAERQWQPEYMRRIGWVCRNSDGWFIPAKS